jgi:nicotinamide-nucleotide amidase
MMFDHVTDLVMRLGIELTRCEWKLGVAESCTGGLLAAAMTSVPGASCWFDRGFVTYSNDAKIEHLAVSGETLNVYGAVSEPIAIEMAAGVLLAAPLAHVAVSTTGIAGPDGGMSGKPVGMVCFGFAMRTATGITTLAHTQVFSGDRAQVRLQAVAYALSGTLERVANADKARALNVDNFVS